MLRCEFDATSLNPSAMYGKNSVDPKTETGFAFKQHWNDVYVKSFNDQSSNENGDESAILKRKSYNPPNLIFQIYQLKRKS